MNGEETLYESCCDQKWSEAREYLLSSCSSDDHQTTTSSNRSTRTSATDEVKKLNVMYRSGSGSLGKTCLHRACSYRAGADIVMALLDIGGKELVMMTNNYGDTALHSACLYGASYHVIKMLVDVGGKDLVMAKNNCDNTALHWLCHYIKTHTEVAEKIILLLDVADANVLLTTKNNDGKRPLEIATELKGGALVEQKAEVQQWIDDSTSPVVHVGTKRKHNDEEREHGQEEDPVIMSQSQSSKRTKVGNTPNVPLVAGDTPQAGDYNAEMIAEQFLLEERDQHTKLITRFMETSRELRTAKAQIIELKQQMKYSGSGLQLDSFLF